MEALAEEVIVDVSNNEKLLESAVVMDAEMPLAVIHGEHLQELPKDLYIPPEALRVFLEAFEGPLDLLLYLIKRQNLDILDIPIADITRQYMEYVELMRELHFELAAEYLLMAAMLAEIKSRMLLPRSEELVEDEQDPRAELVRRLQEYERFKQAALDLDTLPREGRDLFRAGAEAPDVKAERPMPQLELQELLLAFKEVMGRAKLIEKHQVQKETLSVRERMSFILERIKSESFTNFTALFNVKEGRMGVVVTFLATLELLKQCLIEIVQKEPFSPLHIKAISV